MSIWFMRDNHTFLRLPDDIDEAMAALQHEYVDCKSTYGMLGQKCPGLKPIAPLHFRSDWQVDAPRARQWLMDAAKPSNAEIEYRSWIATLSTAEQA